ncbi:hypothetical protein K439DRAFT_1626121 [Ramaria rubella]|nr:hypothetical protein K439DRAFT_1626121 [Ramaria rubella]
MNRHPTPLCFPNIRQPTSPPLCHLYLHLPCTLPALLSLTTASKLTGSTLNLVKQLFQGF